LDDTECGTARILAQVPPTPCGFSHRASLTT
jgi:hypothetical protein